MEKIKKLSLELNLEYRKNMNKEDFNLDSFKENMKTKYSELFSNYESIFNISLTHSYNYSRLSNILDLHQQVKNNEISQHDASVKVGQLLVDDFVKPVLNNQNNTSNESSDGLQIEELE